MKIIGSIFFVLAFTLASCKKQNGCKVKDTFVDQFDFQDSLYSPVLFTWTQQSYDLTLSYCADEPNSITVKYLNSSAFEINATKTGTNSLEIPSQTLESEIWTNVYGNGTFSGDLLFISYRMTNFDDEEYIGYGWGTPK